MQKQREYHPWLGTFNFAGGFIGGCAAMLGVGLLIQNGKLEGILVAAVGLFFVYAYFHTLKISGKFAWWDQLSSDQKLISYLNILLGSVLIVIIIPVMIAGVKEGVKEL